METSLPICLAPKPAIPILHGFLTLSSRGLGHRPFTAVTRVRIPLGSFPIFIGELGFFCAFMIWRAM